MNTLNSFRTCVFKKYADSQGKASRSEYWWFWGIYCLILFGCPLLAFIMEDCFNVRLYSLMFIWAIGTFGLICPFIAVSVRRLHDSGLSGWHFLWRFIPLIGSIVTFFLMIRKTKVTAADRFRMSVRKGAEELVTRKIKECYEFPPKDTEQVLPIAIETYFEHIKNSQEFALISTMTLMGNTWDPYEILQEEKDRILNMIKM